MHAQGEALRCATSQRGAMRSLAEAQAQLRVRRSPMDIKTLRSTAYRTLRRARAAQQSAAMRPAGPRQTRERVVVTGAASGREAQEAWPFQDEEGAQPIPYRLEGTEAPHPASSNQIDGRRLRRGPRSDGDAPGVSRRRSPCFVARPRSRLNAADKVPASSPTDEPPWIPGRGPAENASPRSGLARSDTGAMGL